MVAPVSLELRYQDRWADDGTSNQMWKVRDEQCEIPQALDRFQIPAIHVDDITDRLEGVEGYPYRQNDP